jgi:4-azaleucine resistance transporter AzlC
VKSAARIAWISADGSGRIQDVTMVNTGSEPAAIVMTRRQQFFAGTRDTLPLVVGAIPFGIIFGAISVSSGISITGTLLMSLLVFAGSSQFIAAGLFAQGAGAAVIVFTTLIVNLRHILYSATLAPHLKHLSPRWLVPLGFWLTDETFAVTAPYYQRDGSAHKHWYQLGSSVFMYTNWFVCTVIGVLAGQAISAEQTRQLGFEFAMIVTFIGLVVPLVRSRPMLAAVIASGTCALLTNGLPNRFGLMLSALVGVAVAVAYEWAKQRLVEGQRA